MDRNTRPATVCHPTFVALRKESVDRNTLLGAPDTWTEVALRKESVDRNNNPVKIKVMVIGSLSARRAWIEITLVQIIMSGYARGRSPQGERG